MLRVRQHSPSAVVRRAGGAGPSLSSHVPGLLPQPNCRLQPLWQFRDARWGLQGGGLFPGCDGRGFANSCWRHHFPARHSVSRDLRLRPQTCLIR